MTLGASVEEALSFVEQGFQVIVGAGKTYCRRNRLQVEMPYKLDKGHHQDHWMYQLSSGQRSFRGKNEILIVTGHSILAVVQASVTRILQALCCGPNGAANDSTMKCHGRKRGSIVGMCAAEEERH